MRHVQSNLWLIIVLAVPLVLLLQRAGYASPHDTAATLLFHPGADVGTSAHATWTADVPETQLGLELRGVAGATLVVDEAFVLQLTAGEAVDLLLYGAGSAQPAIQELTIEIRRGDGESYVLDLLHAGDPVVVPRVEPGETLVAGVTLRLAADADPSKVLALPVMMIARPP